MRLHGPHGAQRTGAGVRADLVADTQEEFAEIGLASGEVRGLLVLSGRAGIDETVGGVRIVGERDALRAIAAFGSRLTSSQVSTGISSIGAAGAAMPALLNSTSRRGSWLKAA